MSTGKSQEMGRAGKRDAVTKLVQIDRTSIRIRGRDLCDDIMGSMSLSGFILFHITGREASEAEAKMLDALIISIAEHGMTPTALTARTTYSSGPEALQAAVAAGILGAGSVVLGSTAEVSALLQAGVASVSQGETMQLVALRLATEEKDAGRKLPGFGHPVHKPDDPRAVRLMALAHELGVAGQHCDMLVALTQAADQVWGKHLVLNVQGPIAAVGLDLGLPPFLTKAIPILARAIGVVGHIGEEVERPIGFHLSTLVNQMMQYSAPDGTIGPMQSSD